MSINVNNVWLVERLLRLVAIESMRQRQCFRSRTQWRCFSELKQLHFSDFQRLSPFQFASCFKSVAGCHRRNQKWPVDGWTQNHRDGACLSLVKTDRTRSERAKDSRLFQALPSSWGWWVWCRWTPPWWRSKCILWRIGVNSVISWDQAWKSRAAILAF